MPVIDINGQRVSYTDTGHGAAVVFVPGLAGTGEWFHYQSSGLADRFRVITYDLRKARGAYSLDLLVDDLSRLLLALRIYESAIVGYSLGGMIALKYALVHPDRCPALVLCSTAPKFSDLPDTELISHLLPGGARAVGRWERLWRRIVGWRAGHPRRDDADSIVVSSPTLLDSATLSARLKLMRETDLTADLPRIDAPTLVMATSEDMPYVLSGSQILHESIADSTLEVIEGVDQFYFHTRHDLFNTLLADYLREKVARL